MQIKPKIFIVEDQFAEAYNLQLIVERAGYKVCGIERTVQSALESILKEKPQLVLLDIFLKGKKTGIDLAKKLKEENMAVVYISANFDTGILAAAKETQPYGFLIKPFRENDVLVTLEIAFFRHQFSRESYYHKIDAVQKSLGTYFSNNYQGQDVFLEFGKLLQPYIPFDFLMISTVAPGDEKKINGSYLRLGFNEYQRIDKKEWLNITALKEIGFDALLKTLPVVREAMFFNEEAFERELLSSGILKMIGMKFQMESLCTIPVFLNSKTPIQISFFSHRPDSYTKDHLDLLNYVREPLRDFFQKSIPHPNTNLDATLGQRKYHGSREDSADSFQGIIGKSTELLSVFDSVMQVARFDTSVLLLGETGTGKERVADCIQQLSDRKEKPFVKVNCAALPASLVESELFGHEKGAFTNANETHIGHFEQAMNGTIFLDEIGEILPEVQVKLLRILQEKEIRRVGGKNPLKVNVRVIAATNRNLEELVAQGRFRLDLYYRLNVFPIQLPSLRERREDIPLLAEHFIRKYAGITGKEVQGLSEKAQEELIEYDWPGNIRELENVMERSVLRSSGTLIKDLDLQSKRKMENSSTSTDSLPLKTIEENEREYILAVLKKCNGRVWGEGGAAALLNMPPTTLNSKIKRLGIKREFTG